MTRRLLTMATGKRGDDYITARRRRMRGRGGASLARALRGLRRTIVAHLP